MENRDWRQDAHFFANGKFKISWNYNSDYNSETYTAAHVLNHTYAQLLPDDCTLIARTVDQMTEEEKKKHFDLLHIPEFSSGPGIVQTPESFLYLLSIGVLPPQYEQGLKDGTIIKKGEDI